MQGADKIDQIEAMRMGVEYQFPIRLRSYEVMVRPLANSEMIKAYGNVAEYIRGIPEARRTKIEEDNALAREFLKLASSDYGVYPGRITDAMLDRMTNDEILHLYKEWQAVCDKVNPQLEKMDPAKIKELVEEIKKNPPEDLDFQLTELSFGQMRNILSYLLTNGD